MTVINFLSPVSLCSDNTGARGNLFSCCAFIYVMEFIFLKARRLRFWKKETKVKKTSLALSIVLLTFCVVGAAAESLPVAPQAKQPDLTGTWEGTAEVPDIVDLDKLTMVLEKAEDSYSGTLTDTVGYANKTNLENVAFAEGKLSFSFQIFDGTSFQTIYVVLTVDGDKMAGAWENDQGESGNIFLERAK
jgi:hypothetical protein